MCPEKDEIFENDSGELVNEDGEKLYDGYDGGLKTHDDLSEAEESFYDSGAANDIDINAYCDNYNRDAATDWGSGEDGSLTEDDFDSLPLD